MDKSIKKIKDIVKNIFEITYELFRIMIPTLIVVKILQEFGFVDILNNFLSPFPLRQNAISRVWALQTICKETYPSHNESDLSFA